MPVKWLMCIASLATCACSSGSEADTPAGPSESEGQESALEVIRERYTVTMEATNLDGELSVNGVCIARWENGSKSRTFIIDGWLLQGTNHMSVALAETQIRPRSRGFQLSVDSERWYADTVRGVPEPILNFEWPPGATFDHHHEKVLRRQSLESLALEDGVLRALEDGTYPSVETLSNRGVPDPQATLQDLDAVVDEYRAQRRASAIKHDLPHAFAIAFDVEVDVGTSLWDSAEQVELDDTDRAQILELTRELHRAVTARRLEDVINLLSYAIVDSGRASEHPEEHSTRALEFRLKRLFSAKKRSYAVAPLKEDDLIFQPVAAKKLVALSDAAGLAPIVVRSRGSRSEIRPYFARMDGRWLIARTNEI